MILRVVILATAIPTALAMLSVPANAESSSTPTAQYPWPHNGRTRTSDAPAGVSFTYACNHHDGCYARHWASRSTCDAWFRNDMLKACRSSPFNEVPICRNSALLYYGTVRLFGDKYYNAKGELVRINTPMRRA
jgi:hypothetical protein